jgi:hypothetical protein
MIGIFGLSATNAFYNFRRYAKSNEFHYVITAPFDFAFVHNYLLHARLFIIAIQWAKYS